MATPFSAELKIMAPAAPGQPEAPLPLLFSSAYRHRASFCLEFSDAGDKDLDLGTLGPEGAKLLVISVPNTGAAALPVLVAINAGVPALEISPGGWMALASPQPTTEGGLSIRLTLAAAAKVNVWVFG